MPPGFAKAFAIEWVEAWNAHDVERVLSHYEEDFEISSPIIKLLVGEPKGLLKGKAAVRAYWTKALKMIPTLHFELLNVFEGVNSVTVYYQGHRGLVAEVFEFAASGKVAKAYAHYAD